MQFMIPPYKPSHKSAIQTIFTNVWLFQQTRVPAAAERSTWRIGSAHAKHSSSHHMVIKPFLLLGLDAEYRSRRWVWPAVVRRPSEVYDTHRQIKLTAPETIGHSRDVRNRHLNLPHLYLAPPLGVSPLEFRLDFWHQKTIEPLGYCMALFAWS